MGLGHKTSLKALHVSTLSKQKLIANVSYYLVAALLGVVVQLLLNPFLSLHLNHEDFAIIGYFASFNGLLVPLFTFSLITYYSRSFFLLPDKAREQLRNTLAISVICISLIMSIISMLGLHMFFKVMNVSLPVSPYAMLSVCTFLFSGLFAFWLAEIRLQRRGKAFLIVNTAHALLAAGMAILFVIGLQWHATGKMLAAATTELLCAVYAGRKLITRWEFDWQVLIKGVQFSWPLTLAAIMGYFFSGVDRVFLEKLNDTTNLGLYNIASQIAGYLAIFSVALNNTFQPDILESIVKRNLRKTFRVVVGIQIINLLPIILFMMMAPLAIRILTYGRFTDAAGYARILALKNLSSSLYFGLSTVIIGFGYTRFALINKIICMGAATYMFRLLIGCYGFMGAAWGQVLSFVMLSLVSMFYLGAILGNGSFLFRRNPK